MRRSGASLVLTAAVALLAGCGGSSSTTTPTAPATLDTHRVALAIQQSILSERHLSANVLCPLGIKQQKGVTFTCTATTKFGKTVFHVTVENDRGYVTYHS